MKSNSGFQAVARKAADLPATGGVPPQSKAIADVIVRLNRAVQRATIYPEGHPSVRAAVAPLVEALTQLFGLTSRTTILVSRARLLVTLDGAAPDAQNAPWLSARLSERGLAAIAFTAVPGEGPLLALVEWLARPLTDQSAAPEVEGVSVTWRDYSQARFVDAPGSTQHADPALLWQGMAHGLASDWLETAGSVTSLEDIRLESLDEDPVELAKFVRNTLLTQEGTGVATVASRLVSMGGRLAALPEADRQLLRKKMAAFVAELAPELRGQLLRVLPTDAPEKLAMLGEVIDDLPHHLVLEVVQGMQLADTRNPQPMLTLLSKVVNLSAEQPDVKASLAGAVVRAGGPNDLLDQEPERMRHALELLLRRPVDDGSVSDTYRSQLDTLMATRLRGEACYDPDKFYLPTNADHIAAETPRLALALLTAAPFHDDAPALLRRAHAAVDHAFAVRDVEFLASLAKAANEIAVHPESSPEAADAARSVLEVFGSSTLADVVAALVEDLASPLPRDIGTLMRIAGTAAAEALLERFAAHRSSAVRDRMIELVAHIEPAALKTALTQVRGRATVSARTLVALLCHTAVSNGEELAELFLVDPEPELRLQAFRVLFGSTLTAPRFERLIRRALEDSDVRIAELSVGEVRTRRGALAIRPLGWFLGRAVREELEIVQRRAIAVLVEAGSTAARDALAAALQVRGRAWDARSRRVSRAIERALDRFDDVVARSAVRAWRRSPAGLLSLVLRDRVESH